MFRSSFQDSLWSVFSLDVSSRVQKQSALIFLSICASPHANAWVNLETWKKPKVFDLAPRADTASIRSTHPMTSKKPKDEGAPRAENSQEGRFVRIQKSSASLIGLYPLIDELLAGITVSTSSTQLNELPTSDGYGNLKSTDLSLECAALFAWNESFSLYLAPGLSFKKAIAQGETTEEDFQTLTSYGVWALNNSLGVGLGFAGRVNSRTKSLIPFVGGAWQPTPNFRLDGWLPAHLTARWSYNNSQTIFARAELAGDAALSNSLRSENPTAVQLLGGQLLIGWSIGMPIGIGTGTVRLEPSVGAFRGQLTTENISTGNKEQANTELIPVADVKLAVAF